MNPDQLLDFQQQQGYTANQYQMPAQGPPQGRLTPEQQIKELERAIQTMKENGATEQDPAYANLLKIWNEKVGNAGPPQAPHRPLPAEMGMNPRAPQGFGGEEQVPGQITPGSANMTPQQIAQLKHQMASYKHLSKNAPVPPAIQRGSEGFPPVKREGSPHMVAPEAGEKKEAQDQRVGEAVQKKDEAPTQPGTVPSSSSKSLQGRRFLVPSKTPSSVNPQELIKAREDNIKSRIQYRIAELENLSVSLPNEQKLRALIELKALRLLEYQKKIREEVATGVKKVTTLETSISPNAYKKGKKQSFKESRVAENLEKQQQRDKEQREKLAKQQRRDFLESIINHRNNFKEHHRNYAIKVTSKLGKMVANWHSITEKEEAKRQERKAKERLKALKADDEDAYRKLIDTEKDTRITHLLQQTDQYLGELGAKVLEQKKDADFLNVPQGDDEDGQSGKDFYQIAHSVNEKVTQQSSLLVGGKLKEYQIRGLEWMISLYNNNLNGILADEMGLGKTIQTISLITYLIEHKKQLGPHLVIVPLSTLTNWQLEFEKWAPSVNKVVYLGSPQARKGLQNQLRSTQFNVLLTTYDFVMRDKAALSKIKFNYMIIDEGHRMKNAHCKLTQVLSQFYSSKHRLLLTGTPLQNNLPELWALLNFLLPVIFKSVKSFEEWFNAPFANTGEQLELNEEETLLVIRRLHKVLRPFMLRRLKKDVESELPDKVEKILKCQMSSLQKKLYKQVKSQGAFMTESSDQSKQPTVMGLSNIVVHLRKLCNHPYVFREVEDQMNKDLNMNLNLVRAAGKFELLDRILPKFKASGHKVLMFFQMTEVMNIFEDYCRWREYVYLRLDGNTKAEDRRVAMKDWNDPEKPYFVFLLSTRAGGLGLNLQTADTVIIFDSDWNPHQDLQAQDRAHRIGQTKEVRVYRLITVESVEEHILERAQYKLNVDSKVIQAGKFDQKSTAEERDMLLKALLEEDNQEHEEDDIFDDEELNQVLARDDQELELFRQIDDEIEKNRNREWREMGKKGTPTRLMEVSELPQIYLKTDEEVAVSKQQLDEVEGKRQQKKIHEYLDEGLSEAQWLKLVDEGKDVGEYIRKKRERREKRLQKAREGAPLEDESSEEEDEPDEEPVDEPPRKKRKGEKTPKGSKVKEKEKDSTPNSPAVAAAPLDFKTAALEVLDAVVTSNDKFGRQRAELFLELPFQEDYPTYYEIIKNPIAIDMIRAKVEEDKYHGNMKEFVEDLELMFKNARTYNVQGSQIYDDANFLQRLVTNTVKQQAKGRPSKLEEKLGRGRSKSKLNLEEEDDDTNKPEEDDDDGEDDAKLKKGTKKGPKGKKGGRGSRASSKAPENEPEAAAMEE